MGERARLRNLTFNETFQSSLVERNQEKFTIDKSLAQGIKDNDVAKIIDNGEDGGLGEKKLVFDEEKEIEGLIIDTRKRYDEVKTSSKRTEAGIENLKKKKELLLADETKYNQIISKQRDDLESVKSKLSDVTQSMEATIYRKDIYDFMKDGLKKDILVLKKRYFDKDVLLMRDKTKLKTLRNEHTNKTTLSRKCKDLLTSMESTVVHKHMERTSKIQSLHVMLNKKQTNQRNREIRDREIEEVMVSAMTDKLTEEKQLIKILHANLLTKKLLRSKMERLMLSHQDIELCFHKMKQATSLKDSNEFIDRYMHREQTYGKLLDSIAEKEAVLEEIKEEKQELEKDYHLNLEKSDLIQEEAKVSHHEADNFEGVLSTYNEKVLKISRQKQLIYSWATRFLASYQGHSNSDQIKKNFNRLQTKQLLMEVLEVVKNFMNELSTQQNSSKKIDETFMSNTLKNGLLSEQNFEKNTRIKTLSTYENDGYGESFQDQDVAYDDLSEIDYLQHNRRAIKKNDLQNRRFRIKTKPN